jgi:hypothetical protein
MEPESSLPCSQGSVTGAIMSQMNQVHTPTKIPFSIVLPSTPRPSEWSFSFRLSNQNLVRISYMYPACAAACLSQFLILTVFSEVYKL